MAVATSVVAMLEEAALVVARPTAVSEVGSCDVGTSSSGVGV